MKGLTLRQQKVLAFIRERIDTLGCPPTLHEIKDHFGWVSTNAARTHLLLLEEKGELTFEKNQARGIRLRKPPRGREVREVPLVGQVPAGSPSEAIELAEDSIGVDPADYPDGELFALAVRGDSMEEAGILDGDTVIVLRQDEAAENRIVVALIDGEATVKRLICKKGNPFLHPENRKYDDIPLHPDQHVAICGVVVGVKRRL